jgi:hydrogenase expression/formation protein HypE
MHDPRIKLAHGTGGHFMCELIEEVFARHLGNAGLDLDADAATLPWAGADSELMMTTDGFTVQPLEFPGGDIGMLAVHGTVNDLAVSGAVPRYLSLNVFAEEGLEIAQLRRIVVNLAPRPEVGVAVVRVTPSGAAWRGGGLYATTGMAQSRDPVPRHFADRARTRCS